MNLNDDFFGKVKDKTNVDKDTLVDLAKRLNEDNMKDIMLIEKCLEVYYQWQQIAPSPKSYAPKVDNDFKTIDLSVVDGFMPRIG